MSIKILYFMMQMHQFHLSFVWAHRFGTYDQLEFHTGIGRQAICNWLNFFRDVCAEYFINPIKIGGEGML